MTFEFQRIIKNLPLKRSRINYNENSFINNISLEKKNNNRKAIRKEYNRTKYNKVPNHTNEDMS